MLHLSFYGYLIISINKVEMKIGKFFKSSVRIITFFVPQTVLAKVASEVAIWAVESLVKNTKSKVDDKVLSIVKDNVKKK